MAKTQKMYLGDTLIGKQYLGDDLIIERGAIPFSVDVELLVVAGGGGGGETYTEFSPESYGGGGGAGGMITGSFIAYASDSFTATVGNGGSGGTVSTNVSNGQNSSFIGSGLTITAYGGGGGGNPRKAGDEDGKNGGSGGGASLAFGAIGQNPGTATIGSFPAGFSGFGNNGGQELISPDRAGGGGGAGGAGATNNGGSGRTWVDGTTYARGGINASTTANSGNGGNPATTTGGSGQKGIVKIRYLGTPKATGGTITESGGYTYHTFTSNGTFTVTG